MRLVPMVSFAILLGCGARSALRLDGPSAEPFDGGRDAAVLDAAMLDAPGLDAAQPDAARDDVGVTLDAGLDAGTDAGHDAGTDAGSDGGHDAAVVPSVGCADGEREAYRDRARYPSIAGCSGGWTRPGLAHAAPVTCGGQGGDDGPFPAGGSCGASDLCDVGWHVCTGPSDVLASSPDGCDGSHDAAGAFFATRMSSSGCGICATGTATDCSATDCRSDCAQTATTMNDIFGCGTIGSVPDARSCGPLDRFGNDLCDALPPPWACRDDGSGTHEAELVVKPGPSAGGVLCCRG